MAIIFCMILFVIVFALLTAKTIDNNHILTIIVIINISIIVNAFIFLIVFVFLKLKNDFLYLYKYYIEFFNLFILFFNDPNINHIFVCMSCGNFCGIVFCYWVRKND